MNKTFLLLLVCTYIYPAASICGRCDTTNTCDTMMSRIRKSCNDLFNDHIDEKYENAELLCSDECKKTLQDLHKNSKQFEYLENCNCTSESCMAYKNRIRRCIAGDIKNTIHRNFLKDGCHKVQMKCHIHKKCNENFRHFSSVCSQLLNGDSCKEPCENALISLISDKHQQEYLTCRCDSSFFHEGACLGIRSNIFKYCTSEKFKKVLKKYNIKTKTL